MLYNGGWNFKKCGKERDFLYDEKYFGNLLDINPEEIKILASISQKIQREYQVYFSFGDVVCPHCKNVTKDLDLTIDDLVFQTYQRLMTTEVDLTNIQGL